jgi:hypothetical protein
MKKLLAACMTAFLAVSLPALAADDKKAASAAKADAKLMKPASVKQADWDKMTDAEKKKAVDAAKGGAKKKEKKGGC